MSCPDPMLMKVSTTVNSIVATVSGPVSSNGIPQFRYLASFVEEHAGPGTVVSIDLTQAVTVSDSALPGLLAIQNAVRTRGAALSFLVSDFDVQEVLRRGGLDDAIFRSP